MKLSRCFLGVLLVGALLSLCVPLAPAAPKGKKDLNAQFVQTNLDTGKFLKKFESPERSIYEKRAEIVDKVALKPGMRVADVGAGTGLFTLLFSEKVGASGKVYAADISKAFLTLIEERAKTNGFNNVQAILSTDHSSELAPNSIDVAFICDTYHHFDHPAETMASIYRALGDNGDLIIIDFKRTTEWAKEHVRAGQEEVVEEMRRFGFVRLEEYDVLKDNYMLRFRKVPQP